MNKDKSPFNFLVFKSRPQPLDERFRSQLPDLSNCSSGVPQSSSSEEIDREDSPPPPDPSPLNDLSSVISQISIPKNPLSEIGDPSENRLLKITNSPTVGALTELRLKGKGLSHFESSEKLLLSRLFNLTVLNLSNNYISDISDISQCPGISYLNISKNLISDISPLSSLLKLATFKAGNNRISKIEPLKNCEKLQKVTLHCNSIQDLSAALSILKSLSSLKHLTFHSNPCVNKARYSFKKITESLQLKSLDKKQLTNDGEYKEILQNNQSEGKIVSEESKNDSNRLVGLVKRLRQEALSH